MFGEDYFITELVVILKYKTPIHIDREVIC